MKSSILHLTFGLGALLGAPAIAGASIVNINAVTAGAAISPGGTWNNPTGGTTLSVSPGTYTFQVVDPADKAGAIYTAWSYETDPRYYTGYLVFDASNINAPIIDGSPSPTWFSTAQQAYDWAVASGNNITTYTFNKPTTLIFAVPDAYTADNSGGVSVWVYGAQTSRALVVTPEPGTGALLALTAGSGLAFYRRFRRRHSRV